MTSSMVRATFSSDNCKVEISPFPTQICKFDQWDCCFLKYVLELLELEVSTTHAWSNFRPDFRVDFSPVTFLHFPGLMLFERFSFNLSSYNFFWFILFIILATFGSTSLENATSRSYSAAMDPKKSLSTVFSDFWLSLFCLWHLHLVGAGLWLSSESLGEPLQCPKTMTLIYVESPQPCPGRLRL